MKLLATAKNWLVQWFGRAMTEPDINSRLMFMLGGVVSSLSILILVIAFVCAKDKTGYDYMVIAVSGGAVGHGVSRYLTKKNGGDADVDTKPEEGK